ncbi:Cloroperoxidase [Corynespora cassiicola Philippines]|uniref:Cloroperoxidase n=1 Tax=Corynespora cassiicola Philippines TaxID=1448308 RepID=A0A2T2NRC5_CORCC|nr:Cloroperoxidase [Corynespora cassiicola Philippines]
MKPSTIFFLLPFAIAHPNGGFSHLPWHLPVAGDVRSPCPGLNVLANHNILPHDGKNITEPVIRNALSAAYNLDPAFSSQLFFQALATADDPNGTSWTLADIRKHDIIEIDGSLSRADAAQGDNYNFNSTLWAQAKSFWHGDALIAVQSAADASSARVKTAKETNPDFGIPEELVFTRTGPWGLLISIFGNQQEAVVQKERIEMVFEQEKLPLNLGWKRSGEVLDAEGVGVVAGMVFDASTIPEILAGDGGAVKRGAESYGFTRHF